MTIDLSMELPIAYNQELRALTDQCFALAHRVLEDAAYAEFYLHRQNMELILDNSMHELGHPLPVADLVEAAKRVNANYVIAPDKLGQPTWNLEMFHQTVSAFRETAHGLGFVLCGNDDYERERVLEEVHLTADMLCFPYRENRLAWWKELGPTICSFKFPRVHLLGVSELDELREWVILAERHQNVHFSVDTSKPIKWGLQGADISVLQTLRGCKSISSKDLLGLVDMDPTQLGYCVHNIHVLRSILLGV